MKRPSHSGQALIVVLLTLLLTGLALALVAASLERRLGSVLEESRRLHLTALADAAVAEALAHLAADPDFGGLPAHPFGRGILESRVQPGGFSRRTVTAGARFGDRELWIRAEVRLTADGPTVLSWNPVPRAR